MHHLLLFGWTVRHDYSVIKTGIPLSVLVALLLVRIPNGLTRRRLLRVGVPLMLVMSSLQFQFINRPGPTSESVLRYGYMKYIGETIGRLADPNEVVFIQGHEAMPQIVYYSGRNIQVVDGKEQAAVWLNERQLSNGLYILIADNEIRMIERIPLR